MNKESFSAWEFLALIEDIEKNGAASGNYAEIINDERMKEFCTAVEIAKKISEETGMKMSVRPGSVFKNIPCIRLTGKQLVMSDCEEFLNLMSAASNIDVYPKTDKTITIDFTFHGLTEVFDLNIKEEK